MMGSQASESTMSAHLTLAQRHEIARELQHKLQQIQDQQIQHQEGQTRIERAREQVEADWDDAAQHAPEIAVERTIFDIEVKETDALTRALTHVMDESYGLCTDCQAEIPFERLRVEPQAVRCVPCETRHEKLLAGMR
jgi:RNA polymerase-binding transcription factor DksA